MTFSIEKCLANGGRAYFVNGDANDIAVVVSGQPNMRGEYHVTGNGGGFWLADPHRLKNVDPAAPAAGPKRLRVDYCADDDGWCNSCGWFDNEEGFADPAQDGDKTVYIDINADWSPVDYKAKWEAASVERDRFKQDLGLATKQRDEVVKHLADAKESRLRGDQNLAATIDRLQARVTELERLLLCGQARTAVIAAARAARDANGQARGTAFAALWAAVDRLDGAQGSKVNALAKDANQAVHTVARPEIVCLCGSTRFYDAFQKANYEFTMGGKIVLSVGFYPHNQERAHGEQVGCTEQQKAFLDELHKRKIDMCDRVFVLNVDGYIGSSTRGEIEYATSHGKTVEYLESAPAVDPHSHQPTGLVPRRELPPDLIQEIAYVLDYAKHAKYHLDQSNKDEEGKHAMQPLRWAIDHAQKAWDMLVPSKCPRCEGTGKYNGIECSLCGGGGKMSDAVNYAGGVDECQAAPAVVLSEAVTIPLPIDQERTFAPVTAFRPWLTEEIDVTSYNPRPFGRSVTFSITGETLPLAPQEQPPTPPEGFRIVGDKPGSSWKVGWRGITKGGCWQPPTENDGQWPGKLKRWWAEPIPADEGWPRYWTTDSRDVFAYIVEQSARHFHYMHYDGSTGGSWIGKLTGRTRLTAEQAAEILAKGKQ